MIYNFSINNDYYIVLCREYKKILDNIYKNEYKNFKIIEKDEIINKNYGYFHNIIDWKNIGISLKKNINYLSLTKNPNEKRIVGEFICNYFHIRNLIWHNGLSSKNIKTEKENFKRFFSNFLKISSLINKKYNNKIITDEEIEYITEYIKYIFPSEDINEIKYNFDEKDLEKIQISDDEKEENDYLYDEENIENFNEDNIENLNEDNKNNEEENY